VDFPDLLLTPGVGARTVQSLAMVAEVVHGAPYRFQDPARFSLAHGGKDRHPYPVPLKIYDETIRVLKSAVQNAKLGHAEEMEALRRLDAQARQLERVAAGPSLDAFIAGERNRSPELDGRSVFGWEKDLAPAQPARLAQVGQARRCLPAGTQMHPMRSFRQRRSGKPGTTPCGAVKGRGTAWPFSRETLSRS
jgi:hypothetical protein